MITFHPTISFKTYIHRLCAPAPDPQPRIEALFPGHNITLTDSGRSALALIIETLGLEHKRVALPAYLCNNILPVLEHYHITPVFLDIDPLTYQPLETTYFKETFDVALIVATFGKLPEPSVIHALRNRGIVVVEDWAHVSLPTTAIDRIDGDARYYSLSKTLPVPDGGCAVIPKGHVSASTLQHPRLTITAIKDLKKVWWFNTYAITLVRFLFSRDTKTSHTPSWSGLAHIRPWSRRFLGHALNDRIPSINAYCHPMIVESPFAEQLRLFKKGTIAERIWDNPIIDAAGKSRSEYPNTDRAAQHTLCVPVWKN